MKDFLRKWWAGVVTGFYVLAIGAAYVHAATFSLSQPGSNLSVFYFTCFSTDVCPIASLVDSNGATLAATPGSTTSQAVTVQGAPVTTYFLQPTASNNSTNIKAAAGFVYWVLAENNSATVNYLRFYNTASAPTCTSATGLVTQIQIPASTSVGGINLALPYPMQFLLGIGICVTSGYATTDNTNATATAMSITIGYN